MKKALVISGGGSKGAFAGGVAQYLMKKEKRSYDLFIGTSTGSLMVSVDDPDGNPVASVDGEDVC